jgi:hypothetical protein
VGTFGLNPFPREPAPSIAFVSSRAKVRL